MATFNHPCYTLIDGDRIQRNQDAGRPSKTENEELANELARYAEDRIITGFEFASIPIPDDDAAEYQTSILASKDWTLASKLLLIINNSPGSLIGIFSRSTCMDSGFSKGSMIPYIERALGEGYGVLVLRPNTNSVQDASRGKCAIKGSESPEIHALYVWENIVPQAESATHVALLSYANGASLCKDLLVRQLVSKDASTNQRIKAIITIEASIIAEDDDAADVKAAIKSMAVNLECSSAPRGYNLKYREKKLGCTSLSVGLPPGQTEVSNVAVSVSLSLDPVFMYLRLSESERSPSASFATAMARENGHDPLSAIVSINPDAVADTPPPPPPAPAAAPSPESKPQGFLRRTVSKMFGGGSSSASGGGGSAGSGKGGGGAAAEPPTAKMTVNDFDLLKVVGKGAFGKVRKFFQSIFKIY